MQYTIKTTYYYDEQGNPEPLYTVTVFPGSMMDYECPFRSYDAAFALIQLLDGQKFFEARKAAERRCKDHLEFIKFWREEAKKFHALYCKLPEDESEQYQQNTPQNTPKAE